MSEKLLLELTRLVLKFDLSTWCDSQWRNNSFLYPWEKSAKLQRGKRCEIKRIKNYLYRIHSFLDSAKMTNDGVYDGVKTYISHVVLFFRYASGKLIIQE